MVLLSLWGKGVGVCCEIERRLGERLGKRAAGGQTGWGLASGTKTLYGWMEFRAFCGSVGIGKLIDVKRPAWTKPLTKALSGGIMEAAAWLRKNSTPSS